MGTDFIKWDQLNNPFYSRRRWSVKDACMIKKGDEFYLYYSAFYWDRGRIRSHVIGVKSYDLVHFSDPILYLDGKGEGWTGMCSPNISKIGEIYYLTFNSWGNIHPNGKKNTLHIAESTDLEHWQNIRPIATNLFDNIRVIDIAIAYHEPYYYLIAKDDDKKRFPHMCARIAYASDLESEFKFVGDGHMSFKLEENRESNFIHENFQFIQVNGHWHLLSTDYTPHHTVLYKMKGTGEKLEDWQTWEEGIEFSIAKQKFNTSHRANAAAFLENPPQDDYYYLIYAGRTEGFSHAGRGNNKLGIARSKDFRVWESAPEEGRDTPNLRMNFLMRSEKQ